MCTLLIDLQARVVPVERGSWWRLCFCALRCAMLLPALRKNSRAWLLATKIAPRCLICAALIIRTFLAVFQKGIWTTQWSWWCFTVWTDKILYIVLSLGGFFPWFSRFSPLFVMFYGWVCAKQSSDSSPWFPVGLVPQCLCRRKLE